MMAGASALPAWGEQGRPWASFYADRLAAQLRQLTGLARRAAPDELRGHFESYVALLRATASRAEFVPARLELVDALHPLPLRWGQWVVWLAVLREAAREAARLRQTARQAEYLAYVADLLLNTGQAAPALDAAREAMRLARGAGAAWPLCVAANAASATLRSMTRYEDAQSALDDARAALARMAPPRPPARAAVAETLLDLEQMDLLRYFKRPDEALALGETIIGRLSAAEGVDPHHVAEAYLGRATIAWVSGHYATAADDLQRSATLFRQAGDPLQAIFAEGNLGLVCMSMSRYREAEAFKLAAIRAAEEVNARHVLVTELGDLSVIYIGLGRMERAYDYATRMVELAAELGNAAELSRGRGNRGYILMTLGRYDEALEDIEFSLEHYRQRGRLEGTLVTTVGLALYLRHTGQEARAGQLAQEIYDAAWRERFPHLHIVTARCLALFRAPDERRLLLEEALALARQYDRPMDEAGCLFSLAAIPGDPAYRDALYQQGVELLRQMGCLNWLDGKSMDDPPLLPMTI